jgi:hypothetical protein
MFCSERFPSFTSTEKGLRTAPVGVPPRVSLLEVAVTSAAPVTPLADTEVATVEGVDHEYTPLPLVVSTWPVEPPDGRVSSFTKQFGSSGAQSGLRVCDGMYPPLGAAADTTNTPANRSTKSDDEKRLIRVNIGVKGVMNNGYSIASIMKGVQDAFRFP